MEQRFFLVAPENLSDGHFVLSGDEAHHLALVVRVPVGATITLLDGAGMSYSAKVEEIGREQVGGIILSSQRDLGECPVAVHLAVGWPKGGRADWLVEKATELGVASITPVIFRRSVRQGLPSERHHRIAVSALKQSGRSRLPAFRPPVELNAWLKQMRLSPVAVAEKESSFLAVEWLNGLSPAMESITILIGPEGGLDPTEVQLVSESGAQLVSLGSRRLRTETAAIAFLALCDLSFVRRFRRD